MVSITSYNYNELEDEVLNRVRSITQVFDTQQRVENKITIITYEDNKNSYHVDNRVSYIQRVTLLDEFGEEESLLKYGEDYKISFFDDDETLIFLKEFSDGDEFKVQYGNIRSGKSEWVHPDHPLDSVTQKSTPRIGFELTSSSSVGGYGGGKIAYNHDIMLVFKIVDVKTEKITEICQFLRVYLSEYARTFHNFRYVRPMNYQSTTPFNDGTDNTKSKFLQFIIESKKEVVELKKLV